MRSVINKISRQLLLSLVFFLPKKRKIQLERWHRGREEFRVLQLADVVIVSFGKSGRTWLRVLISRYYQLKFALNERHLLAFDNLHRKNPAVPKIFFTHDNYLKDFTGHTSNKTDYYSSKVILLVRNPLDVVVSQYFQWKFRMRPGKKALNEYPEHNSDISIYDFVMHEKAGLTKIIDYLNLWAAEAGNVEALLMVRYEDMRSDTAGILEKIAKFAGEAPQQEDIEGAVEFASIENMRSMETKKTFWLSGSRMVAKDKSNPDSYKVRKAKVGGYRDYFDDSQIAAMHKLVTEKLNPVFGYDFARDEVLTIKQAAGV